MATERCGASWDGGSWDCHIWPSLIGAAAATVYLAVTTWIQLEQPPEMHGRFFAIVEAAGSFAAPVSYLATGAVLEALGSSGRWVLFLLCGVMAAAWAVVTLSRIR